MPELSGLLDARLVIECLGTLILSGVAIDARHQRQRQSQQAADYVQQQQSLTTNQDHLQDQLQTLSTEHQNLTAALAKAKMVVETHEQDAATWVGQRDQLQQQQQKQEQERQTQQQTLTSLQAELKKQQVRYQQLSKKLAERDVIETTVEELTVAKAQAEIDLRQVQSKMRGLRLEIDTLSQHQQLLTAKLAAAGTNEVTLTRANTQLQEQLHEAKLAQQQSYALYTQSQSAIQTLEAKVADLIATQQQLETQYDQERNIQNQKLATEVTSLQEQLTHFKTTHKTLESELEVAQIDKASLTLKIETLTDTYAQLTTTQTETALQLANLTQNHQQLLQNYDQLTTQLQDQTRINSDSKTLIEKNQTLTMLVGEQQQEIEALQYRLKTLKDTQQQLANDYESAQTSLMALETQDTDLNAELVSDLEDALTQLRTLQQQTQILEQRNQTLEKDAVITANQSGTIATLEAQLQIFQQEQEELNQQLSMSQAQIQPLSQHIAALEQQQQTLGTDLQTAVAQTTQLEQQLNTRNQDCEQLQQDLHTGQQELTLRTQHLQTLEQEKIDLVMALEQAQAIPLPLRESLQVSQSEKKKLEQQLQELAQQNKTLQASLAKASDSSELEQKLVAVTADCDRITQTLKTSEATIQTLTAQLSNLESLPTQLQTLEQQKVQLEAALQKNQAVTDPLIAEIEVSKQARQQLQTERDQTQQEITTLQAHTHDLEQQIADLRTTQPIELEQQFQDLSIAYDQIQQTHTVAAAEIVALQQKIQMLEQQSPNLSDLSETFSPDMVTALQEADQQITTLETKVKGLQQEKTELEKAMKMAKEVVSFFEQQVEQLTTDNQQLESQLQQPDPQASMPTSNPIDLEKDEALPLSGKSFVITGKLSQLNYEQVRTLIQDAGGTINSHPSAKTTYVVVGQDPGNKLAKAEKYNIPQLSEQQLIELLN